MTCGFPDIFLPDSGRMHVGVCSDLRNRGGSRLRDVVARTGEVDRDTHVYKSRKLAKC